MAQVSIDNVTVIPQIAVNSPTKQSTLSFPFVFLPPFVKQHVPKVVSACRLATIGRSDSLDDTPRAWTSGAYHNDSNFNGAITPPPSYAEVVPSQGVDEVTQLQQDARLASNVASLQPAQVTNLKRSGSGIKRKYSRQGVYRKGLYQTTLTSQVSTCWPCLRKNVHRDRYLLRRHRQMLQLRQRHLSVASSTYMH